MPYVCSNTLLVQFLIDGSQVPWISLNWGSLHLRNFMSIRLLAKHKPLESGKKLMHTFSRVRLPILFSNETRDPAVSWPILRSSNNSSGHLSVVHFIFLASLHSLNTAKAQEVFFCILGSTKPLAIVCTFSSLIRFLNLLAKGYFFGLANFSFLGNWKSSSRFSLVAIPYASKLSRLEQSCQFETLICCCLMS